MESFNLSYYSEGGWRMADGGWPIVDGGWWMVDGRWRMGDAIAYHVSHA